METDTILEKRYSFILKKTIIKKHNLVVRSHDYIKDSQKSIAEKKRRLHELKAKVGKNEVYKYIIEGQRQRAIDLIKSKEQYAITKRHNDPDNPLDSIN